MKYDESSIQVFTSVEAIRRRPEMYVGPGGVRPQLLAAQLARDALELGVGQVEVHHSGAWWIVASNDDWLTLHNQLGVAETFNRILPIPGLVNSCRSEVVAYALADAAFTSRGGELLVLKGDEAEVRRLLIQPSLSRLEEKRVVGFRMGLK